jgi:hypothetical protein
MGIFSGWLKRTSKEKHKAGRSQNRAQATQSLRRRSLFRKLELEQLEDRIAPAVTSSFRAGVLTVTSDAADTIAIAVDPAGQDVLINGSSMLTQGGRAAVNKIQQIAVVGGPGACVFDLSQLNEAPLAKLTSFTVTGHSGHDTLIAPAGQANNWFFTGQNQGTLGQVNQPSAVPVAGGSKYQIGDLLGQQIGNNSFIPLFQVTSVDASGAVLEVASLVPPPNLPFPTTPLSLLDFGNPGVGATFQLTLPAFPVAFTGIQNLTGGTRSDTFNYANAKSFVTGTINSPGGDVTLFGQQISIPGPVTTHGGAFTINDQFVNLNTGFFGIVRPGTGSRVTFTNNVATAGGNLAVFADNISLDTTGGPVTLSTRKLDPVTAKSTGNSGSISLTGINITLGSSKGSQGSASLLSQVDAGSAFTPGTVTVVASEIAGAATGNGINLPFVPIKLDISEASIVLNDAKVIGGDVSFFSVASSLHANTAAPNNAGNFSVQTIVSGLEEISLIGGVAKSEADASINLGASSSIVGSSFTAIVTATSDAESKPIDIKLAVSIAQDITSSTLNAAGHINTSGNTVLDAVAVNNLLAIANAGGNLAGAGAAVALGVENSTCSVIVPSTGQISAGGSLTVNANTQNNKAVQAVTTTGDDGNIGIGVAIASTSDTTTAQVNGHVTAVGNTLVQATEVKGNVSNTKFFILPTFFSGVSANTGVGTDDSGDEIVNMQGVATQKLIGLAKNLVGINSNNTQKTQSQAPGFQAAAAVPIDVENNVATATIGAGAVVHVVGNLTVDANMNDRPNVVASSGVNKPSSSGSAGSTTFEGSVAVAIGIYTNTATALIDAGATVDAGGTLAVTAEALNDYQIAFQVNLFTPWLFQPNHTTDEPGATTATINQGDIVLVNENHKGGGTVGHLYKAPGALGTVDLTTEDFSQTGRWIDLGSQLAFEGLNWFSTLNTYQDSTFGADNNFVDSWSQATATDSNTKAAAAGSVTYLTLNQTSNATIGQGAQINQDTSLRTNNKTQNVFVLATGTNSSLNLGGSVQTPNLRGSNKTLKPNSQAPDTGGYGLQSSDTSLGIAVVSVTYNDSVTATIDPGVNLFADSLDVNASTAVFHLSAVVSGADSGNTGFIGVFSLATVNDTTLAQVAAGAHLSVGTNNVVETFPKFQISPFTEDVARLNDLPGTRSTDSSGAVTNTIPASTVVQAHDGYFLFNVAGAVQSAANTGVGASVAIDNVSRDTEAFIGDPAGAAGNGSTAVLNTLGNVIVDAKNNGVLGTLALAAAKSSSNSNSTSQSSGDGVGVSGDVSINNVTDVTLAYLHHAQVTAHNLALHADNPTVFIALGGSAALELNSGSSSTGIAGSFDQNGLNNLLTRAFLDSTSVTLTGDLQLDATNHGQLFSIAASGSAVPSGSSGLAIAGQVSVNSISATTTTDVVDNSSVHAANVSLESSDKEQIVAVAGGLAFGGQTGIGAAVDTNTTDTTVGATVDASTIGTSAQPVSSLSLTAIGDDQIGAFAVGGGFADKFALGGSVLTDSLTNTDEAKVSGGAQVNAAGNVAVIARGQPFLAALAGALGVAPSGSAGVGVAVNTAILHENVKAHVDPSVQVTAQGDVTVAATSEEQVNEFSGAGSFSNSAGVAISPTILTMDTVTEAFIDHNATVIAGGDVSVTARDTFEPHLIDGSVGFGSSAGIGAANTTLVHNTTVEAFIGDSADVTSSGADGVTILADAIDSLVTISAGAAGSEGASLTGSATVNDLNETTKAFIDQSATVNAVNGNISVTASNDTTLAGVAGSLAAAAGPVAAGLGADVESITKTTLAYIESGVTATAKGDIIVQATSSEAVVSVAAGVSISSIVSVALDAAVHVFNLITQAFIGDNPADGRASAGPGNVHAQGSVVVNATDNLNLNKVVGVLAVSGTAGVAAAGGVTVIDKTTEAFIGAGANVSGDGNSTGPTVNTGQFQPATFDSEGAFNPGNPSNQGIEANDPSVLNDSASHLVQVGHVSPPGLDFMNSGQQNGGKDTNDPSFSGDRSVAPAPFSGFHGVAVTATNQDAIRTLTIALAGGGAVGVGVAADVNVVAAHTRAFVGAGATVNSSLRGASTGQSVLVGAANDFYHLSVAGSLAIGATFGGAPAADVTVVGTAANPSTTEAFIAAGATVNAQSNVSVAAHSTEDFLLVGFGGAGGLVGVGAAVSVLSVNNHVGSFIGAGATVFAGGNVAVTANDDTTITTITGALAGGFVGVGGAVGVLSITKDTEAHIDSNAHVDASGFGAGIGGVLDGTIANLNANPNFEANSPVNGVIVQAQSSENIFHLAVAGSGGVVGVAGGVGVTLINSHTQAKIAAGAQINQLNGQDETSNNQGVYVVASNDAEVTTFAGALGGGFVGVSGGVDVGELNNNTAAEMDGAARANKDVEVNAVGIKNLHDLTFSGAGGFAGVTGAVSVWGIGQALTKNYQDKDGHSADALSSGGGPDADNAAAAQGQLTTDASDPNRGGVVSRLRDFGNSSDPNANQNLKDITSGAADRIENDRPSQDSPDSIGTPPPAGTSAVMGGTAIVQAGGNIQVKANEDLQMTLVVGGFAGGFVGASGAVSVVNVADNASALAGGTLRAVGDIFVNGTLNENAKVIALDGSGGAVALGAAVAVFTDRSTTTAHLTSGTVIDNAAHVFVEANTNRQLAVSTGGNVVGAAALGVTFTQLTVTGDTTAGIDDNAQIGQNVQAPGSVGGIDVESSATINALATTNMFDMGAGSVDAASADVTVTPTVSAEIGDGSAITTQGAVNVTANGSEINADAEVVGTSVNALLSISGMLATATTGGATQAGVGSNASITSSGLNVAAEDDANFATANVSLVSAGLINGAGGQANGTVSRDTIAFIGNNTTVNDGASAVNVHATANNNATTSSQGLGAGAVDVSIEISVANVSGNTDASVGPGSSVTGALSIQANDSSTAQPSSLVAGINAFEASGATASAVVDRFVDAFIGNPTGSNPGAQSTFTLTGSADVEAHATESAAVQAEGASAGVVALGVSVPNAEIDGETLAYIGPNTSVTGGSPVTLIAADNSTATVTGTAKHVSLAFDGVVVSPTATIARTTQAFIDTAAQVEAGTAPVVVNASANDTASSIAQGVAGGLGLSVAAMLPTATISGKTEAFVADGANVRAGSLDIEANIVNRQATAEADVFGLSVVNGGIAAATAKISGDVTADIGNNVSIFVNGAVTVRATSSADPTATANIGEGGAISGGFMDATGDVGTPADINPADNQNPGNQNSPSLTSAFVGNNTGILNAGSLDIEAIDTTTANITGSVDGGGVLQARGAKTVADLAPVINASIGSDSVVNVNGNVIVRAQSVINSASSNAADAGGGLIDLGVAHADITANPNITSLISSRAIITATGSVTVDAEGLAAAPDQSSAPSFAQAQGGSGGGFDLSEPTAEVNATYTVFAGIFASLVSAGQNVNLETLSQPDLHAEADNGSGGVVAISSSEADVRFKNVNLTFVGANTQIVASNDFTMNADSNFATDSGAFSPFSLNASATSESGGVFAGTNANATTDVNSDTEATVATNASITADHVLISAGISGSAARAKAKAIGGAVPGLGGSNATAIVDGNSTAFVTLDSGSIINGIHGVQIRAEQNSFEVSVDRIATFDLLPSPFGAAVDNTKLTETVNGLAGATVIAGPQSLANPVALDVEAHGHPSDDVSTDGSHQDSHTIDWSANAIIYQGVSPTLVVNSSGLVTDANNASVELGQGTGFQTFAGISVDPIANAGGSQVVFNTDVFGIIGLSGNVVPTFEFRENFQQVDITNLSNEDLFINEIDVINRNLTPPQVTLQAGAIGLQFNIQHDFTPTLVDIKNFGSGDIVLAGNPLSAIHQITHSLIENPIGDTRILNTGGNIRAIAAFSNIRTNTMGNQFAPLLPGDFLHGIQATAGSIGANGVPIRIELVQSAPASPAPLLSLPFAGQEQFETPMSCCRAASWNRKCPVRWRGSRWTRATSSPRSSRRTGPSSHTSSAS